jgi:hypothetical protein
MQKALEHVLAAKHGSKVGCTYDEACSRKFAICCNIVG